MVTRATLTIVILAVAVPVAAGLLFLDSFREVEQPIAFSHLLHIDAVGLECTDCHLFAETGVRATIPNLETCSSCHEDASGSEDIDRLLALAEAGTPIPWQKVYWVPDHVYFSHRRHTAMAEIACDVCHGDAGTREQPFSRPLVALTMDQCMDCHYETGASNDCIACHR